MARKCKEDAEKTRQAVLESALDVFSEKGYAKATFDEIAARAGFNLCRMYRKAIRWRICLNILCYGPTPEKKTCAFPGSTGL